MVDVDGGQFRPQLVAGAGEQVQQHHRIDTAAQRSRQPPALEIGQLGEQFGQKVGGIGHGFLRRVKARHHNISRRRVKRLRQFRAPQAAAAANFAGGGILFRLLGVRIPRLGCLRAAFVCLAFLETLCP